MVPMEYTDRPPPAAFRGSGEPAEEGSMWIFGVNPVLEHLRADPRRVRRVLVAREAGRTAARVLSEADRSGVRTELAERRRLDRLFGTDHQGVAAEVEGFCYTDWETLRARTPACLLVADQVTDPRNLGALIRTAEAAGVGGVVVPRDRSAGVTAVVVKAAAGASAFLPVARVTNLARALRQLKESGYWIVGLDVAGDRSVFDFGFPERSAIVVGGEGRGLRPLTRASCDFLLRIPQEGRVGSLNVAVAAGVACFEWLRQRRRIDSSAAG
jgi:23S rRNA (guanosine2251-2'-O)-methyltransferase